MPKEKIRQKNFEIKYADIKVCNREKILFITHFFRFCQNFVKYDERLKKERRQTSRKWLETGFI